MIPPGGIGVQARRTTTPDPARSRMADRPARLAAVDPRDDLDSLADGVDCAACGQFVPTDRIRVLARRDDIAFVEIHCPACRSESLGILIASEDGGEVEPTAVGPGWRYGEFGPGDEERFREALPIGPADLDTVHELLSRGGITALVGGSEPPAAGPGR
jgi:hypothetical protein